MKGHRAIGLGVEKLAHKRIVRGFDLLKIAVQKDMRAVMLTAHALSPENLKRAHDMGARAYLPKDKIGEIVPFLEAALKYEFEPVRSLMQEQGLTTISILWSETDELFHSRNPFAGGGVYEDPATGAAAAALAGYLRDIGWIGKNTFTILQGEDMGMPSRLLVKFSPEISSSVAVSGETRYIE